MTQSPSTATGLDRRQPSTSGRTGTGSTPARLADDTGQGKTTIASGVVQKIAGIAARDVSGVYSMGGGVSRAFGAIRERIPGGTAPRRPRASRSRSARSRPRSTSTSSSSTAPASSSWPAPCAATSSPPSSR